MSHIDHTRSASKMRHWTISISLPWYSPDWSLVFQ